MDKKLIWEEVPSTGLEGLALYRARVPGGWLTALVSNLPPVVSLTFVPGNWRSEAEWGENVSHHEKVYEDFLGKPSSGEKEPPAKGGWKEGRGDT